MGLWRWSMMAFWGAGISPSIVPHQDQPDITPFGLIIPHDHKVSFADPTG